MPVSSRPVIATVTPQDYNLLRADLLDGATGHTHNGVEGARVNHSDLVHPNNYNPINTHAQIDTHIASEKNVHGAPQNFYVVHSRERVGMLRMRIQVNSITRGNWNIVTLYFDSQQRNVFADESYMAFVSIDRPLNANLYRFNPPIIYEKKRNWVKIAFILDEDGVANYYFDILIVGPIDQSYTP